VQTRIRHFRKTKGKTLRELADLIGTTPQTVQRLETAHMTVSTDWLERIATALEVRVVDLLDDAGRPRIPVLGLTARGDRVVPGELSEEIGIDVPADDPVALRVSVRTGPYEAGSLLIGNRYREGNLANAVGRDGIVALADGTYLLRRVAAGSVDGGFLLVSLNSGGETTHVQGVEWIAPIVMSVRYL